MAETWQGLLSGWRPYGMLIVLGLLVLAPGLLALPPVDRDESRFAQSSHQILESGDWIDIRLQDRPRYKKPIGIYWLQAASTALFDGSAERSIWAYRLPSLIGALAAVLLTFVAGRRLFDPPTAFLAAIFLLCSLLLNFEARQAKSDAVLLASIVLAQASLANLHLAPRRGSAASAWDAVLFWFAIGAGILVKGPVILLVSGLTIAALAAIDRDRYWMGGLRPMLGLGIVALVVGPWFLAISLKSGAAFLNESLGRDLFPKLISGQESHLGPAGYHAFLVPLMFWPASLVALAAAPWVWRHRKDPAVRFCLAWLIPSWLVLEAMPTKLPHYVLPAYPALALLAAAFTHEREALAASWSRWRLVPIAWWAVISVTIALALASAPIMLKGVVDPVGIVAASVVLAVAWMAVQATKRVRTDRLAPLFAIAALCLYPTAFGLLLPRLDPLWLTRSLQQAIDQRVGPGHHVVASSGYSEPSLVFALGTDTRLVSAPVAAALLASGAVELALVSNREENAFQASRAMIDVPVEAIAQVVGIDYSVGRRLTVTIYRADAGCRLDQAPHC